MQEVIVRIAFCSTIRLGIRRACTSVCVESSTYSLRSPIDDDCELQHLSSMPCRNKTLDIVNKRYIALSSRKISMRGPNVRALRRHGCFSKTHYSPLHVCSASPTTLYGQKHECRGRRSIMRSLRVVLTK